MASTKPRYSVELTRAGDFAVRDRCKVLYVARWPTESQAIEDAAYKNAADIARQKI